MPGRASLTAGCYYAHPHNAFWRILGELLGFDARAPYPERIAALLAARIALWDVLHSCERVGSLDASIGRATEQANDFAGFLAAHPAIRLIAFNGALAEAAFRRHVRELPDDGPPARVRLPSTSPAHASLRYADKLAAWRCIIGGR